MKIPHQEIWLKMKLIIGAAQKAPEALNSGKIGSLTPSFRPSQKGCNNPPIPETWGPKRRCIEAIIWRSASVKNATHNKTGIVIVIIESIINYFKVSK
jgi:hypothetical protein